MGFFDDFVALPNGLKYIVVLGAVTVSSLEIPTVQIPLVGTNLSIGNILFIPITFVLGIFNISVNYTQFAILVWIIAIILFIMYFG